ncbi:MAG TPA: PQQ-dependent sugar dehydrogenase [Gemmatimonadaceae bacterium]|nr:PQQ-dependent sugar dehydrogenase [Gemmatimonadaceae bacterium]
MRRLVTQVLLFTVVVGCRNAPAQGSAQQSPNPGNTRDAVRVETVATGLEHPWAFEPLPDGRFLVTERPGRLRIVNPDGTISPPLPGVPRVAAVNQGGLLDVALDPAFASNSIIYLSFSEPGEGGTSTAVARARLTATGLQDVRVIYSQVPKVGSSGHFGSRIVFRRDGTMFVTQGDRQANQFRGQAQELASGIGKIVRINSDGSVPRDNPFVGRAGARPEIWSYGHRNVQAAALHPETGQLWTVEHGARGGDELNHPEAGKNYGWPVITYGRDYGGGRIGEGTERAGMEQPVYYWDPVIAPSGMTFYTGDVFPGWKGSILVGGLASQALVRLTLRDGRVASEERHLGELGQRIRDVKQGVDGLVYVITDAGTGKLLRLRPASR